AGHFNLGSVERGRTRIVHLPRRITISPRSIPIALRLPTVTVAPALPPPLPTAAALLAPSIGPVRITVFPLRAAISHISAFGRFIVPPDRASTRYPSEFHLAIIIPRAVGRLFARSIPFRSLLTALPVLRLRSRSLDRC